MLGDTYVSHSIPYTLTALEISDFLTRHPELSNLPLSILPGTLALTGIPPYGIVVNEAYGQYLVWYDATGSLRVIDVTNMAIAGQVNQAPFVSPDSGVIQNMIDQIQAIANAAGAAVTSPMVWVLVAGLLIVMVSRK